MEKRKCRFCQKVDVPLMKSARSGTKQYYCCRECQRDIKRKWYTKPENKLKQLQYNKKYNDKRMHQEVI